MAKSIKVETIVNEANSIFRNYGRGTSAEYLSGMKNMVEWILIESGEYRGVRFLAITEVPIGQKPGIHLGLTGGNEFVGTDPFRIQFII